MPKINESYYIFFKNPEILIQDDEIDSFLKHLFKNYHTLQETSKKPLEKKIFQQILKKCELSSLRYDQIRKIFNHFIPTQVSEETLIEKFPEKAIENFRLLEFNSESERKKTIEALLKADPRKFAESFQEFQLQDPEKEPILLKLLIKDPRTFAEHFEKFNITDEILIEFFAFKLSEKIPDILLKNLSKFKISDEEKFLDLLAVFIDKVSPWILFSNFPKVPIQNQARFFDLALVCARKNSSFVIKNFELFNYLNDEYLTRLAEELIRNNPSNAVFEFKNFKLLKEEVRFNLVLFLARNYPASVNENFEKFEFLPELTLTLAKLLIDQYPKTIHSLNVSKLLNAFTDNALKKEICEYLLGKDPKLLAYNLNLNTIPNSEDRFVLIQKFAEKDPIAAAENFSHFDFKNQEERFKVASMIAEKAPLAALTVNFKLLAEHTTSFVLFLNAIIFKHSLQNELSRNPGFIFQVFSKYSRLTETSFLSDYLNISENQLLEHPSFEKAITFAKKMENHDQQKNQLDWIKKIYLVYFILNNQKPSLALENLISSLLTTESLFQTDTSFDILKEFQKQQINSNRSLDSSFTGFHLIILLFGTNLFFEPEQQTEWKTALFQSEFNEEDLQQIIFLATKINCIYRIYDKKKQIFDFFINKIFKLDSKLNIKEIIQTCTSTFLSDRLELSELGDIDAYSEQTNRFDLAKKLALKEPQRVAKHIKFFHLNEEQKKEIAFTIHKTNPNYLIPYFSEFEFSKESLSSSFILFSYRQINKKQWKNIEDLSYHCSEILEKGNLSQLWTSSFIKFISKELSSSLSDKTVQTYALLKLLYIFQPTKLKNILYRARDFNIDESGIFLFLQSIDPSDEFYYIELLKLYAANFPNELILNFNQIQTSNETELFDIARSLINRSSNLCAADLSNFDRLNENNRLLLVERFLDRNWLNPINEIQKFHLNDDSKYLLLKKTAERVPEKVIEHIDEFKLTSNQALEIAYILVKQKFEIKNLGYLFLLITDSNDLLKLRTILLDKPALAIRDFFFLFNREEDHPLKLAYIQELIDRDARAVASNFASFGLQNEEERFELAKIIAKKYPLDTLYGDFDLDLKRELPFILFLNSKVKDFLKPNLEKAESFLSQIIYGLTWDSYKNLSKDSIESILAFPEHPLFVDIFEIIGKEPQTEKKEKTLNFLKKLQCIYRLTTLSQTNPVFDQLVLSIFSFLQTSESKEYQKILTIFPKISFFNEFEELRLIPPHLLLSYFLGKNMLFNRSTQKKWLEILLKNELSEEQSLLTSTFLLEINSFYTAPKNLIVFFEESLFIGKSNLQAFREKLFFLSVVISCNYTLKTIENKDYTEVADRFEIAKKLVEISSHEVASHIMSFSLNESMLKEIGYMLAKKNPKALFDNFHKFGFPNAPDDSNFVFFICDRLNRNNCSLANFMEILYKGTSSLLPWMIEIVEKSVSSSFLEMHPTLQGDKKYLTYLKIKNFFTPFVIKESIRFHFSDDEQEIEEEILLKTLSDNPFYSKLYSSFEKINIDEIRIERSKILRKIQIAHQLLTFLYQEENSGLKSIIQKLEVSLPVREISLRWDFITKLSLACLNSTFWELIKTYPSTLSVKLTLPYISGALILSNSHENDKSKLLMQWGALLKKHGALFVKGNHMSVLLELLMKLENSSLPQKTKEHVLLKEVFYEEPSTYYQRLKLLLVLLAYAKEDTFNSGKPYSLQNLKDFPKQIFKSTLSIDTSQIVDFFSAYEKYILTMRDPHAFIYFASKIESYYSDAVLCLGQGVTAILNGTFKTFRYQTPHLQILENKKTNQELLEKWKEGDSRPLYKPFSKKFIGFLKKHLKDHSSISSSLIEDFLTKKLTLDQALSQSVNNPIQTQILLLCGSQDGNQNLESLTSLLIEKEHQDFKKALISWNSRQIDKMYSRSNKRSFSINFIEFLKEKLTRHRHLANYETRLPQLHEFLMGNIDLDTAISSTNNNPLEKEILFLCTKIEDQEVIPLRSFLEKNDSQFKHDLNQFQQKIFSKPIKSYQGWKLADTDDPSHLILMGRETGGCLSIDTGFNKHAAVANLIDGKTRVLVVLDENNKIVARAILRLLLDENDKPILLLEPKYTLQYDEKLEKVIEKYAMKRAKKLNLRLVKQYFPSYKEPDVPPTSYPKFKEEIYSKGSNAPYEYTDSGIGMTYGVYSIKAHLYLLYSPALGS